MMSQRKLDMVGTYSTVLKRAKRATDVIVKTTANLKIDVIQNQIPELN